MEGYTNEKISPPEGYVWGIHGSWVMPEWMEPYRGLIADTGGNPVEWLMSLGGKDTKSNLVLGVLAISVSAQVSLLCTLHAKELLKG
jgi:hypothetical protein